MRYHALASDYDGTLALHGNVDEQTIDALQRLLATGRRLILVTGRELDELLEVFPQIDLFEWVVAENGALLYHPGTKSEKLLGDPPPPEFVQALQAKNVAPMSVGRAIVATWEPHEQTVLETIRDQELELQVIFNKGAVMVLPAGVNKASGLRAALLEMKLSSHNVVGVGDAENDHALLRACEVSAAVSNALDKVKETADLVTASDHGQGVTELIDELVASDLVEYSDRLTRHELKLGVSDEQEVTLSPYGQCVLICGPSASGKSTVATRVIESLVEQNYQFCVIDPEGDYAELEGAVVFGGPTLPPSIEEVLNLLERPDQNAVVCLTGMPIPDRPQMFLTLLSELLQLRTRTGRPHWIVLDEAHHLMPAEWVPPDDMLPPGLNNVLLITVHLDLLAKTWAERINTLLTLGPQASEILDSFAAANSVTVPEFETEPLQAGEVLLWQRDRPEPPRKVHIHPCKMERKRHSRKYVEGELAPDQSFYFRGPEGEMNLRAQNLMLFLQLGDGVDDATWDYHLRRGDYSEWFSRIIKDDKLAAAAQRIEGLDDATPQDTRKLIRAAVEQNYTLPAGGPMPVPGAQ